MSATPDPPRHVNELITLRAIWVTFALSLIVHVGIAALRLPDLLVLELGAPNAPRSADRLQVRLDAVVPASPASATPTSSPRPTP